MALEDNSSYLSQQMLGANQELYQQFEAQIETLLTAVEGRLYLHPEWLAQKLALIAKWQAATQAMAQKPTALLFGDPIRISGYTYLKNAVRFDYPFIESLLSALWLCDEMVVTYAVDGTDETQTVLEILAQAFPQIRLFPSEVWQPNQSRDGALIRHAAEEAQSYCQGDWWFHIQADEVYHLHDLAAIQMAVYQAHATDTHGFYFPILHFYGAADTLVTADAHEVGWYQYCMRLVRAGLGSHMGDAWNQELSQHDRRHLSFCPTPIYHYGHIRQPEAMRLKESYMGRLYHEYPEDYRYCPPNQFRYDRVPARYLQPFQGRHPAFMANYIQAV